MNNHILVIDNDEDDRFLIKSSFEAAGAGIRLSFAESPDGIAAFISETGKPPGVVIVDPIALDSNGLAFISEIRQNSVFGMVPIIVYSVESSAEHIKEYYESGASSFIVKPPTFAEMVTVAEVIHSYWLRVAALPKPA